LRVSSARDAGVQAVEKLINSSIQLNNLGKIVLCRLPDNFTFNFLDDNLNQSVFFDINYLEV
jgi:hypothetical protein